jgi:gamma-polyglutamate biosynthesis protein CapA
MLIAKLVGDIFPANLPYNSGFGVAAQFQNNDRRVIYRNKLKNLFNDSDLVFANLESPLIEDAQYSKTNKFAGHVSFAEFLNECGVSILSVANNHMHEQGPDAFQDTIEVLRKNNIEVTGIINNNTSNIIILEKKDLRLGFTAYNAIDNTKNPYDLYAKYSVGNVLKDINNMKQMNLDYIFISLHWGSEYMTKPSPDQIADAHQIIDAGANFIIGHHPHVIQPIEKYNGGLIFYSLGNFIFDMSWTKRLRTSLMIELKINKKSYDFSIIPLKIEKDYFPVKGHDIKLNRFITYDSQKDAKVLSLKEDVIKKYQKVSKRRRLINRILMKQLLIKNWFQFPSNIRKEFIMFYFKKIFK